MNWLTWRQMRTEALIGGIALIAVAIFVLWTGLEISSAYESATRTACIASDSTDNECREAALSFLDRYSNITGITAWLILVPFLIGLLLAAPIVLDLEQGNYRLAWTQTVTRARWFLVKTGLGLAIGVGISAVLIGIWTWWREPFDAVEGRWVGTPFYLEGSVTFAHLAFTFAICLATGALLRRTIPAAGIACVSFIAVLMVVENVLRPRYMEPKRLTFDPTVSLPEQTQSVIRSGDHWVISEGYSDAAGTLLPFDNPTIQSCVWGTESKTSDLFHNCLYDHGISFTYVYQPANRFWIFQGIETALLLSISAVLLGFTYWWVTRRIAR